MSELAGLHFGTGITLQMASVTSADFAVMRYITYILIGISRIDVLKRVYFLLCH
jgi:hypothetical protein